MQIQVRIQESQQAEDSFELLFNGFTERAHDCFIRPADLQRFQDLVGTIVAHNFRGQDRFQH